MRSRCIKMAAVLLLGFVLAWHGVFAVSAFPVGNASSVEASCCSTGCDSKHCATPACCVKRDAPSSPADPASLPAPAQNELYALVATVVSLLPLPVRPANELPTREPSPSSVTAIPLFQRDCCYLL